MKIYAHRGNKSEFPENSLQAFRSAVELGVDGVEVDVQLTLDQKPLILHDETVNRTTTGTGYLKDMTSSNAKTLRLLNPDGTTSDESIPTLEEMLHLFDQLNFTGELNIELKTDQLEYEGIEQIVMDTVQQTKRAYKIIYSSFNWYTMLRMKALNPEAELALLIAEPLLAYQNRIPEITPSALHVDFRLVKQLDQEIVHPYPLRLWTINEEAEIVHWLTSNHKAVDVIMTDYPRRALSLRDQYSEK